jgi:hypothetical protein
VAKSPCRQPFSKKPGNRPGFLLSAADPLPFAPVDGALPNRRTIERWAQYRIAAVKHGGEYRLSEATT